MSIDDNAAPVAGFSSPSGGIDLSANTNACGASPAAVAALARAASGLHLYPARFCEPLTRCLARKFELAEEQVLCANGASAIIEFLLRDLPLGAMALWPWPSFVLYEICAKQLGRDIVVASHRDWHTDIDALLRSCTPTVKLILIANPNNPTGTWLKPLEIERLLKRIPRDVLVAVDEAYQEFVVTDEDTSCRSLIERYDNLVIIRSFSKAYGLAGLRIGYALGAAERIAKLRRHCLPFQVSSLAQEAACAALDDEAHLERSRRENAIERARVSSVLGQLGVAVPPSQANFVFLPLSAELVKDVERLAAAHRLLLGRLLPYGLDSALRVSIGSAPDNDRFLTVIARALQIAKNAALCSSSPSPEARQPS